MNPFFHFWLVDVRSTLGLKIGCIHVFKAILHIENILYDIFQDGFGKSSRLTVILV